MSEQSTIDFFSKLLEDKEQKITFLQKQNEFLQVQCWYVFGRFTPVSEQGEAIPG